MGSGDSYRSYSNTTWDRLRGLTSKDEESRTKAIKNTRYLVETGRLGDIQPEQIERQRDTSTVYDASLVKSKITAPSPTATELYYMYIDNSGSNETIARHCRESSGRFTSGIEAINATCQFAFDYFSDHCDVASGRYQQQVDYISPNQLGDKILHSTVRHIHGANGGDHPEAIECVLKSACELNFGHVPQAKRHLILITDSIPHGMGSADIEDSGCPSGQRWQDSIDLVRETFGSFRLVSCTADPTMLKLQKQIVEYYRAGATDTEMMDLSFITSATHRMRLIPTALLFYMARDAGGLQVVEAFLTNLYAEWLQRRLFGDETDRKAKEVISHFVHFTNAKPEKMAEMMNRIFID